MESDSESLGRVTQALTANVRDNNGEMWIVYSVATCHRCNNQELMYDFVKLEKLVEVQLGDGKVLRATGRGTVTLFTVLPGGKYKKCKLQNVLLVPKLSYNLLSVSKATEEAYSVSFEDSASKITRPDGVIIAIGRKVGCLYYLDFQRETENSNSAKADSDLSKEMLWHQRNGHLGAQNLNKLANDNLVTGKVFSKFCEWKALVEKYSGHKLKTLRTDNGGEFMSSEFQNFLKIEGVRHELTVPKTPQQNGVAERLNSTLVESARTILIQARLLQKFWVEALNTTVYLHNRSPTRAVDGATPFETWTGEKPDVKHLRSFGCIAYICTYSQR